MQYLLLRRGTSGLAVIVASLLVTSAAWTEDLQISLVARPGVTDLRGVAVELKQRNGERMSAQGSDLAPALVKVELSEEETWTLTCVRDGVWCPRFDVRITDGQESRRVDLNVYPLLRFEAEFETPRGAAPLETARAEAWVRDGEFLLHFSEMAAVEEGVLRWELPATWADLRISAESFSPIYLWDVRLSEEMPRPTLHFRAGASLSGFVVDPTGGRIEGARIAVASPDRPLAGGRADQFAEQTTSDGRGFFQLQGLSPGIYTVSIESEGHTPRRLERVELAADSETRLGEVALDDFAELTTRIDPPLDPDGLPWRIHLLKMEEPWTRSDATADELGWTRFEGLDTGAYRVRIFDSRGERLHHEMREIDVGYQELLFELSLVRVEGEVLLGGEGLESEVELSTGLYDRTRLSTDEDGFFSGTIPRPEMGVLYVDVLTPDGRRREVDVEPEIDSETDVLVLILELDEREIRARALDAKTGDPIPTAAFKLERAQDPTPTFYEAADSQGRHWFSGLDRGPFVLTTVADGYNESKTDGLLAQLEGDVEEIEIHLEPGRDVEIKVLSASGHPVAGAQVALSSGEPASPTMSEAHTSVAGLVRLRRAPEDSRAFVSVVASSQPIWSGCVSFAPAGETTVVELPPGPGGTILVTNLTTNDSQRSRPSQFALVTPGGGLISLRDLRQWQWQRTRAGTYPDPRRGELAQVRVTGVASDYYARLDGVASLAQTAAAICRTGPPAGLHYDLLSPGGVLELGAHFAVAPGTPTPGRSREFGSGADSPGPLVRGDAPD